MGGGERPQESHRARGVRRPLSVHGPSADRRAVGYGSPGEVGPPGAGTPGAFGVRDCRRAERPGDTEGEQILREACFRAKEWQEENPRIPPLVMSVNLSASQLSRLDLADTVERVLGETGLEGSHLILDVTETVYVKVLVGNTAMLDRLRGLGVRFSIDDFGTGYSSLSYLKRLPADAIKIDKTFVKALGEDVEDTAVVRMIIELAHTLSLEVIAEGVETEEQATLLKEMGCDFAQGYHFSKPLPPEAASGFSAG